jgi:glutathione S-transferase
VNFGAAEYLNDAFRSINPHRTVPVLELDDGTKLLDSNSIGPLIGRDFPGDRTSPEETPRNASLSQRGRETPTSTASVPLPNAFEMVRNNSALT